MKSKDIKTINKALVFKYLDGRGNINCASVTIYDKKDNRINLGIGIGTYITLQYITGDREILQKLNQLIKNQQLIQQNKQDYRFKQLYGSL